MRYLFILILIYSCSKGGGSPTVIKKEAEEIPTPVIDALEIEQEGIFQAILKPVNNKISQHVNGALTLVRENEEFIADVRLSAGPANVLHIQHLYTGDRCPEQKDDTNGDGYIDGPEGAKIYKEVLIPLDDDLSSQRMGLGIYPASDEFGFYYYSRATDFKKMIEDLWEEDINLTDEYVKLTPGESIKLINKVIVIFGVPSSTTLPDTVSGHGRLTPPQALPIACGVVKRLTKVPGVIDHDMTDIPLPEGGSIGGSNGGEDDGADFHTESNPEEPGNYGED